MEYRTLSPEEYNDIAGRILYEDNHLIIFNKRVGEIVQGDITGDEPLPETLKAFIAARNSKPGKVFMGVPHRLDRPVSGICIFAKTSKALERMNEMFRCSNIHKTYWALCADGGSLTTEWTLLENSLVRNEKQNKSYVSKSGAKDAKVARLKCHLIGTTERYKLVEVELMTGRHHQIRCQLSHIGYTIKGDLKYGSARSNPNGGICLMARNVRFEHPVSHIEINVDAPVPQDWPSAELI